MDAFTRNTTSWSRPAATEPDQGHTLSPERRGVAVDRLESDGFDIVVIGGGVVGCATALEATARGLHVGLVEKRDFGSGESGRTSTLVNGHLRTLGDLWSIRSLEARHAQIRLLEDLAPHLLQPVGLVVPLKRQLVDRLRLGLGLALHRVAGGGGPNPLPRHRHLGRKALAREYPAIDPSAVGGGLLYFDGQVDDARVTMTLARTAQDRGAIVTNSVQATGLRTDQDGRVTGVEVFDVETGHEFSIEAKATINTSGLRIDELEGDGGEGDRPARASKSAYLLVPREAFDASSGVVIPSDTHVVSIIPWNDHWIIGTTETDWDLELDHPVVSRSDIDRLLEDVNPYLRRPLDRDDVVGTYAGLRIPPDGRAAAPTSSHGSSSRTEVPGLVSVAGGDVTAVRDTAAAVVDRAIESLGIDPPPSPGPRLPLIGAGDLQAVRSSAPELASRYSLDVPVINRLIGRYGDQVPAVLHPCDDEATLLEELGADTSPTGYLRAEVRYAVTHEGALHLDDVLARRTRVNIETEDSGTSVAAEAAELVGPLLGWDAARRTYEVSHYVARVVVERECRATPEDDIAGRLRGAPNDSRTLTDRAGSQPHEPTKAQRALVAGQRLNDRVRALLDAESFFVNIGANDGVTHDPLHAIVAEFALAGLAIEPNPHAAHSLRENLSGNLNIIVEECLVAPESGTHVLHYVDLPDTETFPWSQMSSMDPDYIPKTVAAMLDRPRWASLVPADFSSKVKMVTVPAYRLEDLLDRHGIDRVDVMNVDVEGRDFEILQELDLEALRPAVLIVEDAAMTIQQREVVTPRLERIGYSVAQRWLPYSTVWVLDDETLAS